MRRLRGLLIRMAGPFRAARRERDLTAEFDAHASMQIADNLRAGMSDAEARREAALKFGGLTQAKESMREMSTVMWLETTAQDVKYAVRGLIRNRGFAAAAILSLALGIGASVAIFAVADSLLLRPLPFRDPSRVVLIWERNTQRKSDGRNVVSPANYRDWATQSDVFEKMGLFSDGRMVLSDGSRVEELESRTTTPDFLPMLGVQPVRGRFYTAEESAPGGPNVLVISHRLWQGWFGGEDSAIGRSVQLRSTPATIIGVLPPGFHFGSRNIDLWSPYRLNPAEDYRKTAGHGASMGSAGRLKAGVQMEAAQAQMTAIARRLEIAYPEFNRNWTFVVEPLRNWMVRDVKTSLLVLLGAVGLLLAVACANVANLLLARYTARRREMAVRVAIGAGRGRVVRQLITESVVLGLTGGVLGLVLARFGVAGLVAMAPRDLARTAAVSVDLRIVLFAVTLSILTGILFGLAPSLVASRTNLSQGLREDSRSSLGGGGRMRSALVAGEVALSLVLLAGAGLLFRTLIGLQGVDPGLDASGILTFRVSIPVARYREPAKRAQFFERAVNEMAGLPGVRAVSAANELPFNGFADSTTVQITGRPDGKPADAPGSAIRIVMPGYFSTMGIPVKVGRDFTAADNNADAPYRFIVNESFVKRHLPGEDPLARQIGPRIRMGPQNPNLPFPSGDIIGVAGDVREGALDRPPVPTAYFVHSHLASTTMSFALRAEGDPLTLAEPARRAIRRIDAELPVAEVRTMEAIVRETFSRQRFSALLLAAFSMVSVLVAAVGIYGVLAYMVTERTREIGVRVALGAEPSQIISLVLASGARVILIGIAAGIGGALALTGMLETLLYGVKPHDWPTFVAAPALLAAVAMIAAYVPARRAARLLPVDALRAE